MPFNFAQIILNFCEKGQRGQSILVEECYRMKVKHDVTADNVLCLITFTICFDRCLKKKNKVKDKVVVRIS